MIRRVIGVLILFPIWYFTFNPIVIDNSIINSSAFRVLLSILVLGVGYSLLHKKNYPVKFIVSILVAEFIIYKLNIEKTNLVDNYIYWFNLIVGSILVLLGEYGNKAFVFILSPIKRFLKGIGIAIPSSIIASFLLIPIGTAAIEISQQWREYRREERIKERIRETQRRQQEERKQQN